MTPDQPTRGRIADGEHRYPLRVFYEDTDAAQMVYHANYLRFFERARTDMLEVAGIDYFGSVARGEGAYVVAAACLEYRRPARLGDTLVIVSRIGEMRVSSATVQQRVMRDGEEVASGRVTVVFVGPDGRPRRQPAAWIEAFGAVKGAPPRR